MLVSNMRSLIPPIGLYFLIAFGIQWGIHIIDGGNYWGALALWPALFLLQMILFDRKDVIKNEKKLLDEGTYLTKKLLEYSGEMNKPHHCEKCQKIIKVGK